MKRRNTGGFELTGEARDVVDAYHTRTKIPKKVIVQRVLQWFGGQKPIVRRVVLNDVDEGMEEAYACALEAMAKEVRESRTSKTIGHARVPASQPSG